MAEWHEYAVGATLIAGVMIGLWFGIDQAEKSRAVREAAEAARRVSVADGLQQAESGNKRFSAVFHGEFFGGYQGNVRQIFIITDSVTGVEYLTVTGCGTTELRRIPSGKATRVVED